MPDSPPDLADVLAEGNRWRRNHYHSPLTEMPRAPLYTNDVCATCPLALALEGRTSHTRYRTGIESEVYEDLPELLSAFVYAFDNGEYPELIAND